MRTKEEYEWAYGLMKSNIVKIENFILLMAACPETTDEQMLEARLAYQHSLKRLEQAESYLKKCTA